ncbi:palmitoyltransferase [Apis cerana cerana]|uniref:Palmitoyltransferase n=1 Tax=Apis cerana cerana TaxID=94128 RepID=A0A2A3EA08_APICC|nr:palmitoyltransferase [Apis cerana cerana]
MKIHILCWDILPNNGVMRLNLTLHLLMGHNQYKTHISQKYSAII